MLWRAADCRARWALHPFKDFTVLQPPKHASVPLGSFHRQIKPCSVQGRSPVTVNICEDSASEALFLKFTNQAQKRALLHDLCEPKRRDKGLNLPAFLLQARASKILENLVREAAPFGQRRMDRLI